MCSQRRDVVGPFAQRRAVDRKHVQEVHESCRIRPAWTSRSRSRLVEATTRRSSSRGRVSPKPRDARILQRVEQACPAVRAECRRSRSRKSVPPWASSSLPGLSRSAAVKAPRTWPKSSLSIMSGVTEPHLKWMSGLRRRSLSAWIAEATIALPVPLSPVMSTLAFGARHHLDPADDLADRGRCADDVVMRPLDVDRLLQVGVFLFEPVAQRRHLLHRFAQLALVFPTFGDVAKDHHGTGEDLALVDRRRDVLDADRPAVLAPEHLVFDPVDLLEAEGLVDRAFLRWVEFAVEVMMVDLGMDVLAQKVVGGPAQHFLRGAVDECRLALGVDAIDAFARSIQDQLVLLLELGKERLCALPLAQAPPVEPCRAGGFGAFLHLRQIGDLEHQRLHAAPGHHACRSTRSATPPRSGW